MVLALLLLAGRLAVPALATDAVPEQTVTPITPRVEQRVEALDGSAEQRVQPVDAATLQGVAEGTKSPAHRALDTAGKVVIGVVAAAISVAVMAASLLLI